MDWIRYRFGRACRCTIAVALLLLAPLVADKSAAGEHTIKITRHDCDQLVEYVQGPDVAYQPGVDVDGRPVAPADLDGGWQVRLPEVISIDITRDRLESSGLSPLSPLFQAEAFIGVVDIDLANGHVRFNGADLSDPETQALAAFCRESGVRP